MIPSDWRFVASTIFVISLLLWYICIFFFYDFFSEEYQYGYLLSI